jgi:hypothetical protein
MKAFNIINYVAEIERLANARNKTELEFCRIRSNGVLDLYSPGRLNRIAKSVSSEQTPAEQRRLTSESISGPLIAPSTKYAATQQTCLAHIGEGGFCRANEITSIESPLAASNNEARPREANGGKQRARESLVRAA